jgi:hypothetical protein
MQGGSVALRPGQNIDHSLKTSASDMHIWLFIPNFVSRAAVLPYQLLPPSQTAATRAIGR